MNALKCNELGKYFYNKNGRRKGRFRALGDVSFEVDRGEIFGLIGSNGSGKSTLIRILSTLLIPDAGSASVFGIDVVERSLDARRLINRVSVEAAFFKRLSAAENLTYAGRLYGLGGRESLRKSREILERLGFDDERLKEPLGNLSRGQQQKVAVARALLTSPVLLLLDEPTTGLDPKSKRQVQQFVREVRDEHDATILLTSHDMDEVERVCDRIAVINQGALVGVDTADGLKRGLKNGGNLEDVFLEMTDDD